MSGGLFQVVPVVKNPPANAGDIRDVGPIPVWGRSPGGGSDIVQSQRVRTTKQRPEPGLLLSCPVSPMCLSFVSLKT